MYNQDLIEAVLHHADIVHVISSYIPVEKKGRNYLAICPFHDDKNPSMHISSEKQIFKCFVCGTGGNAISFVQQYEKISFMAAVRKVAELSGYNDPRLLEDVPKVTIDPGIAKLHSCINDLQNYYKYALSIPEADNARRYLDSRELGEEVRKKYGIGYAPKDGKFTVKFLLAKGHSLKNIDDIGIAFARGEDTSDHNAGRVIFPLHDPSGQVIGFSARRIEDDGTAKYINSPETPLFHKGNVLYNYHNAINTAKRDGYCYVLEGFMDVMALDKAGIPSAIALMGTALTKEQIALLKRLRCEIRLCLDGDLPGQMAMMKASAMLSKAGLAHRLVDYEGDERDPDDLLRQEGAEGLKKKLEHLVEPIDFQLGYYLRSKKLETPEERQKVLMTFLPYLREKPAGIEFEDTLVKIAEATGYQSEAIRELLRQSPRDVAPEDTITLAIEKVRLPRNQTVAKIASRLQMAERTMIHYMLQSREAIDYFEKNIGTFTSEAVFSTIAEFIIEFAATHPGNPDVNELLAYIGSSGIEEAPAVENAVSSIALSKGAPPLTRTALSDCASLIASETREISGKMAAERAIASGSREAGAAANKALAENRRNEFNMARRAKKG